MTPDEIESQLRARAPAPPGDAVRERALAAARAKWTARAPIAWHWRLASAAAALVALDAGVTAWASASSRALTPPLPPATIAASAPTTPGSTPTLLALRVRGAGLEPQP